MILLFSYKKETKTQSVGNVHLVVVVVVVVVVVCSGGSLHLHEDFCRWGEIERMVDVDDLNLEERLMV